MAPFSAARASDPSPAGKPWIDYCQVGMSRGCTDEPGYTWTTATGQVQYCCAHCLTYMQAQAERDAEIVTGWDQVDYPAAENH